MRGKGAEKVILRTKGQQGQKHDGTNIGRINETTSDEYYSLMVTEEEPSTVANSQIDQVSPVKHC